MEKIKKHWEIQKNWQLLFPFLGVIVLAYSSYKLSLLFIKDENVLINLLISAILFYILLKLTLLLFNKLENKWKVNYKVAENGEEVLKFFERSNFDFDLVLMDLQMPVLDGYETAKVIRNKSDKSKANIPIIALTAFAQTDIKEKTKQYKMNGFMGKPFNPEKLYKLLKSYSNDALNEQVI